MILTQRAIIREMELGSIVVRGGPALRIGPNSVDVHLGELRYYDTPHAIAPWDMPRTLPVRAYEVDGHLCYQLRPGCVYLGVTQEYTETHQHVPYLDGRSSIGRLGVHIHCTAGRGDIGFCGHWTMEIHCVQPVLLPAGARIGQITYHTVQGEITGYDGRYQHQPNVPVGSRMWGD